MKVDRAYLKTKCSIRLTIEPEDDVDWRREFEGQTETLQWIEAQLASDNEWAWCRVKVTVTHGEMSFDEHLGGCSYGSREEFVASGGYYDDMVDGAVGEIAKHYEEIANNHELWEHDKRTCIECLGA